MQRGHRDPKSLLEEEGLLLVTTFSPSCSLSNKAFSSKYDTMLISIYSFYLQSTFTFYYIPLYNFTQHRSNSHSHFSNSIPIQMVFHVVLHTQLLKKHSRKEAQWCSVQALQCCSAKEASTLFESMATSGEKKEPNLCSSWISLNTLCTVPRIPEKAL